MRIFNTSMVESKKPSLLSAVFSLLLSLQGMQAIAQQQQWASQVMTWTFDKEIEDVWNIDQEVWLPEPNTDTFWPLYWTWANPEGSGGYLGLQQVGNSGQVRFSVWDALEAEGKNCRPFDGEGIGYTCTLPVEIDTAKLYRYRLWRMGASTEPWWGAWLIEADSSGKLQEHYIGKIKAPPGPDYRVDIHSITNFVEFWGQHISPCEKVPQSVVGFTAPTLNYAGNCSGTYEGHSNYNSSEKAAKNICNTGTETDGAIVTTQKLDLGFSAGVLVILGGSKKEQVFNLETHAIPGDLGDCKE